MLTGEKLIVAVVSILALIIIGSVAGLEWYHAYRGDQWVPRVEGHWIPAEQVKTTPKEMP